MSIQKDYEIMCMLQTAVTFRMTSILSILSDEKYTNDYKVEKVLILVKDYWKESFDIIEELQHMDISTIETRLYLGHPLPR